MTTMSDKLQFVDGASASLAAVRTLLNGDFAMSRKGFLAALLAVPLVIVSFVYGQALSERRTGKPEQLKAGSFICPVTGEELPCPKCCPLNK